MPRAIAPPPWALPLLVSTALATACGWIDKAAAEDTKVVIYSAGPAASVTIDGGAAVELGAGKFQSFAVGPGTHEVVFDGSRKVSVTLEAFDRWVVPAVADQCFFSIDVSASHYSADGKKRLGGPDIAKRQQQSEPFKFPRDHHLTEKELPSKISSGTLLYMLRSLPCEELDRLQGGVDDTPAPKPARPADPKLARLVDFNTAIGCKAPEGVAKAWCVAAGAWTHATDAKLAVPEAAKSYVGLRVEIPAKGDLASVLDGTKLSLLAVRPEDGGGVLTLNTVNPESDDERAELDAAIASIRAVFAGKAKAVELADGLAAYVDALPKSASTPLTTTELGWSAGGVELRPAGPLVAALQDDGNGNLTLSFHLPR